MLCNIKNRVALPLCIYAVLEGAFADELALLQPSAGYMRLVKDRILYVWEQRRAEAKDQTVEQEKRVKLIHQKLDRLDDAFLFQQSIDAKSYERQRDRLREELTLAQIDHHAEATDELDVQGSTTDQTCENQLLELRKYVEARGWTGTEFMDRGVSGAKDKRPALDALLKDAKRRRFDVLVCWRLDRLGRNLRHLVTLLEDLQAVGVSFVSLGEGIDCTTPAGKLQLHILAALAEFERERIRERVLAGLQRARTNGTRLGRPKLNPPVEHLTRVAHMSLTTAAAALGISRATLKRWRRAQKSLLPVA